MHKLRIVPNKFLSYHKHLILIPINLYWPSCFILQSIAEKRPGILLLVQKPAALEDGPCEQSVTNAGRRARRRALHQSKGNKNMRLRSPLYKWQHQATGASKCVSQNILNNF